MTISIHSKASALKLTHELEVQQKDKMEIIREANNSLLPPSRNSISGLRKPLGIIARTGKKIGFFYYSIRRLHNVSICFDVPSDN